MPRRPTRFLTFATQRTGSSWVTAMLGSHPAVDTYGEQFDRDAKRPGSYAAFARGAEAAGGPLGRLRTTFGYLDELYAAKPQIEATGFKLMYSHAKETPTVLPYIALRRVRVVHLRRSNLLDVLVSDDTARARGRFHSSQAQTATVTVTIDSATVLARLRGLERQVRFANWYLRAAGARMIEVRYENLVADPRGFAAILRFLGVSEPDRELSSDLRKLNTVRKADIVVNYDEVAATLRGTPFAAFLD